MTMIKTWRERCEEHPDHEGIVTERMIRNRMQEEIDELRQAIEQAEDAVAAQREACAKLCDEKVDSEYATGKVDHNEMAWTQACAIAIRARGEQ
jgi:hypothetical protein